MKSLVQKFCAIFVIQIDYFIARMTLIAVKGIYCCQIIMTDHNIVALYSPIQIWVGGEGGGGAKWLEIMIKLN